MNSSPDELLEAILIRAYPPSILSCSARLQTCRRINKLVKESTILQLSIEAFAAGYVLCPDWEERMDSSMSIRDLLNKIMMNRSPLHRITVKSSLLPPLEDGETCDKDSQIQTGGVCAELSTLSNDTSSTGSRYRLSFYRLSDFEAHRNPETTTTSYISPWISHNLSSHATTFRWDLSQDLLLFRYRTKPYDDFNPLDGLGIQLRKLSTGEPHPLAIHHRIPHTSFHNVEGVKPVNAGALGSLLYLSGRWGREYRVGVWNWKTGIPVLEQQRAEGYQILTDKLIALFTGDDGDKHYAAKYLAICCIDTNHPKVLLQMPFKDLYRSLWFKRPGTHPSDDGNPLFGALRHDKDGMNSFIHVMGSHVSGDGVSDDGDTHIVMSVPELLKFLPPTDLSSHEPTVIPWHLWIPQATRWIVFSREVEIYVHKSTVYIPSCNLNDLECMDDVGLQRHPEKTEERSLIFDFNPRSMRRARAEAAAVGDLPDHALRERSSNQIDVVTILVDKPTMSEMRWYTSSEGLIKSNLPFRLIVGPPYKDQSNMSRLVVSDLLGIRQLKHATHSDEA